MLIALTEIRAEEAANQIEIGPHGRPLDEATSKWADPARRREGYHYEHRVRIDWAQRYLNQVKKDRGLAYPDEDADSLIWSLVRIEDGPIPLETP